MQRSSCSFRGSLPLALLLSLGVFASACSSSSNGGVADFAAKYCDLLMPCCTKAGLPANPSQCRALFSGSNGAGFDQGKADACLRETQAVQSDPAFCSGISTLTPSCDEIFGSAKGGTKAPGDTCDTDADCASSTTGKVVCQTTFGSGGTSTSRCQVLATGKEGDGPCSETLDGASASGFGSSDTFTPTTYICNTQDGLYCPGSSFTSTGTPPPVCTRIADLGGACDTTRSTTYACVKTAYCDFSTEKCVARIAVGGTCSGASSDCVAAAYCDVSSTTETCTAQLAEGAACTSSEQCLSFDCNGSKCTKPSGGDLGLAFICGAL